MALEIMPVILKPTVIQQEILFLALKQLNKKLHKIGMTLGQIQHIGQHLIPHSALRECTFAALERSDIEECSIGAFGVHIGIIAGAVGGKCPGIGSTISEPRFRCFGEVR